MKTRYTNKTETIEKDICLFCGTKLDYQNDGKLDDWMDDYNEPFAVQTFIWIDCPACGAHHTAKFMVDKEDFVSSNTDEWWVRIGGGWMECYGYYEDEEGEKKEFSFDMECAEIEAEINEDDDE